MPPRLPFGLPVNPARIPTIPDAPAEEYGAWATFVWVAVYALFIGGLVGYLLWKLPRQDNGDDAGGE